jgi:aspartyl-tRNA(Asn)/glutamyl-tRNA(Gln) amidotransferase subunit C
MALTRENVEKIAALSRLKFKEEEIETFRNQLNNILAYVDKLAEVNTDDVEPVFHAFEAKNVFREDIVKPSLSNELAVKNAPNAEEGAFIVPKVVG